MQREIWLKGMAQLRVCCKDRDLDKESEAIRAECYWRDLSSLSDGAFIHAVQVLRKSEWFPSIESILDEAARAPVDDQRAQRRLLGRIAPGAPTDRVTPPLELFEAIVQEHPRRADEGPMAYIVRIAEEAGIPPGGPNGQWPKGDTAAAPLEREGREQVMAGVDRQGGV